MNIQEYWHDIDSRLVQLLENGFVKLPSLKEFDLDFVASDISEEIQSIEIYGAGAFRTKLSIKVNDEFIYQDNLNIIDRYLIRNPKLIEKIKRSSGL